MVVGDQDDADQDCKSVTCTSSKAVSLPPTWHADSFLWEGAPSRWGGRLRRPPFYEPPPTRPVPLREGMEAGRAWALLMHPLPHPHDTGRGAGGSPQAVVHLLCSALCSDAQDQGCAARATRFLVAGTTHIAVQRWVRQNMTSHDKPAPREYLAVFLMRHGWFPFLVFLTAILCCHPQLLRFQVNHKSTALSATTLVKNKCFWIQLSYHCYVIPLTR